MLPNDLGKIGARTNCRLFVVRDARFCTEYVYALHARSLADAHVSMLARFAITLQPGGLQDPCQRCRMMQVIQGHVCNSTATVSEGCVSQHMCHEVLDMLL